MARLQKGEERMLDISDSLFKLSHSIPTPRLLIGFLIVLIQSVPSTATPRQQEEKYVRPALALDVILPNDSQPPIRLIISKGGRSMTLIHRHRLTIIDQDAAKDFTAVDIWADGESNAIKVRLSLIYNDLSNPEWWKDKKEKILGWFAVQEGELFRPTELAQYGIVPFEMKTINARPIVFQPGEGLRIVNNTKTLEVVRLEKSLDQYQLWLKNNSSKNVVAYYLSVGDSRFMVHGQGYANRVPIIPAGETQRDVNLQGQNVESSKIAIRVVVFDDDSFEGDTELAARFLAKLEGMRIQAPTVLQLVEQALEVDDAELQVAFNKLEAQLGGMREAIDKQRALDLLKSKYTSFDEKTLSVLYEDLKAGLYEAKNMGLMPIGNVRRHIQELERDATVIKAETKAGLMRETLTQIKQRFETVSEKR
jgi:hypothetical protein